MDILLAAAESIRIAELNGVSMKSGKIQKLHVKRKRGIFKCDQCTSVFGLRHNLLRHKRTIHEGKRPFKCNVSGCNASFVQRFDLQTHAASVHDKRKDFTCRICQRGFSQRSNLLTHLRSAHEGISIEEFQQMLDESTSVSSTCSTVPIKQQQQPNTKVNEQTSNVCQEEDDTEDDIPVAQLPITTSNNNNKNNNTTTSTSTCYHSKTTTMKTNNI